MSKLYTRHGDQGQTSLVGGKRVPKYHTRIETYGTIDELSSHLGLLHSLLSDTLQRQMIEQIQQTLFDLSTILATEPESKYQPKPLDPNLVTQLEQTIDTLQSSLPPLRAFILPGGTQAASQAHICRTVCRRAERHMHLLNTETTIPPITLQYINRLSDYLFILARHINNQAGIPDVLKK